MPRRVFAAVALLAGLLGAACGSDLPNLDLWVPFDGSLDGSELVDATPGADASSDLGADAPLADAADAGPTSDASVPASDPGQVTCGLSSCVAATTFCCARPGGPDTCETSGGACANAAVRKCDEAADCPVGNVCCYDPSTTPPSTSCQGDCTGGGGRRVQACKTTTECLVGQCATRLCSDGRTVATCGPLVGLCP